MIPEVSLKVMEALEHDITSLTAREIRLYRHAVDRFLDSLERPRRDYEAGY